MISELNAGKLVGIHPSYGALELLLDDELLDELLELELDDDEELELDELLLLDELDDDELLELDDDELLDDDDELELNVCTFSA